MDNLARSLRGHTKLLSLKLDLERVGLGESFLSCYCGYYLRVAIQLIPIIGSCCINCLGLQTSLEKLSGAIANMEEI